MYRVPGSSPPVVDRTIILPGVGIGAAIVGRVTPEEVLELFGDDCRVSRYEPSNEIFEISYEYKNQDEYDADREAQLTRPAAFRFEFGLCQAIEIGVYQEGLVTREGLRIGHLRPEVLRIYGPATKILQKSAMHTLRYSDLGIDVDISDDDNNVMGIEIYRARC